jgi:glycosyltransferase involved in cell wall biosynthesis
MQQPRPTICLAMIVRDEASIITRCLESVKPWIDHFVICDTGSTDDTAATALKALEELPGGIVCHDWVDFGHNRTLALQLARQSGCDYILVIDADEVLVVEDPQALASLTHDAYRVEMRFPNISYPRVNVLKSTRDWRYVGVIHEYAACTPPADEHLLRGVYMWTDGQGARGRSGTKSERDVAVMEQWVVDEPHNPRAWFYLAQGYETVKRLAQAVQTYHKRTLMGDYIAEVWYSHYRIAQLLALQGDWPGARQHYLEAYECQPHRAEPLYWLAIGHHNRMQDHTALLYLEPAGLLDKPLSDLFVEDAVYDSLRHLQYAVCLHNVGKREEARAIAVKLLQLDRVPLEHRPVIENIAQLPGESLGTAEV